MNISKYKTKKLLVLLIPFILMTGCQANKTIKLTEESLLDKPFPQQNQTQFIFNFEKHKIEVSDEIEDEDEAVKKAAQKAVAKLKIEAIRQTAIEINSILANPLSEKELNLRVEKAASINANFVDEFKLLEQETDAKQVLFATSRPENVILTGYFKINRAALKSFIVDTVKTVEISISENEVLSNSVPSSTSKTFVASFDNVTKRVPDNATGHEETVTKLVNELKLKALNEAADDINHALAQPMNFDEFNKSIRKANKNFQKYISDWKLTNKVVDQSKNYLGTIETIRLSGWFAVDKDSLRKALIDGRAITTVAKYRTYVEAFWNVDDKDISPELMQVVIGNIEDSFSQNGYDVVEFERIKGDLVEMLNKDEVSGIYSTDELERFNANLELRNIDSKFENGKRILADYADLLIGVTVNSMEVVNQMMNVRLTVNATLFENGEWVKLASADKTGSIPYIRGDSDGLISIAKRVAVHAADELEAKARKQISLRKTKEDIKLGEEREFTMVFNNLDSSSFNQARKQIKSSKKWNYKGADHKSKLVRVGYRGQIDSLSDLVEDLLNGAGVNPGSPEYTRGRNRIIFGKE